MFPASVERLRPLVPATVPDSIVLAAIRAESAGKIGARAGLITKSAHDPACGLPADLIHRCLGLGQVSGAALETYNDNNPGDKVTACQLAGESWSDAAAQVKVCAWLVAWGLKKVHAADPVLAPWPLGELTREQALQADLIYSRGPGAWKERRNAIIADGDVPTFEKMEARFPDWGAPHETPFKHARKVVTWAWADFDAQAAAPEPEPEPEPEVKPEPEPEPEPAADSALLRAVVIAAALGLVSAAIVAWLASGPAAVA